MAGELAGGIRRGEDHGAARGIEREAQIRLIERAQVAGGNGHSGGDLVADSRHDLVATRGDEPALQIDRARAEIDQLDRVLQRRARACDHLVHEDVAL